MAKTMSDEHKDALAQGRNDGRAVRRYLEALEGTKARRGRPVDLGRARQKLEEAKEMLAGSLPALERLQLAQHQIDLEATIASGGTPDELPEIEKEFIAVAAGYAQRKGISYSAWRQAGVPAEVLRQAGIART